MKAVSIELTTITNIFDRWNTKPIWSPPTVKFYHCIGRYMEQSPQELTTLVGREVYSNNGVFVGQVEDIRLDLDAEAVTGLALNELNGELLSDYVGGARGVLIPYRWVRSVGDVILINDIVERLSEIEDADEVVV